jgi:hypothetical protein
LHKAASAKAKYFQAKRDGVAVHGVTQKPTPLQIRDLVIFDSKFFFRESAS